MSDGTRFIHGHNAIGDYRAIDPDATVTELVPRAALSAPAAPKLDLHAAIMNIRCHDDDALNAEFSDRKTAYQAGHRHARHASAELVRAALSAPAVPPGWVLVPVEPTPEMLAAIPFPLSVTPNTGIQCYRAMIAAAQSAKEPQT
jgi:hypothetical protein